MININSKFKILSKITIRVILLSFGQTILFFLIYNMAQLSSLFYFISLSFQSIYLIVKVGLFILDLNNFHKIKSGEYPRPNNVKLYAATDILVIATILIPVIYLLMILLFSLELSWYYLAAVYLLLFIQDWSYLLLNYRINIYSKYQQHTFESNKNS